LVAEDANPDWLAAAAYDAYSLTYSDGSDQITLLAGQWRTAEAAQQAFGQLGGDQAWPGAAAVPTGGPTSCPEAPDPDIAALWLNRDAIFRVDAPAGGAAMFYCQMPY
jgi:hypothetical protein